jgi:hypothetical protein
MNGAQRICDFLFIWQFNMAKYIQNIYLVSKKNKIKTFVSKGPMLKCYPVMATILD